LKELFCLVDQDSKGLIDSKKMQASIRDLGKEINLNRVQAAVAAHDDNGDGILTFSETTLAIAVDIDLERPLSEQDNQEGIFAPEDAFGCFLKSDALADAEAKLLPLGEKCLAEAGSRFASLQPELIQVTLALRPMVRQDEHIKAIDAWIDVRLGQLDVFKNCTNQQMKSMCHSLTIKEFEPGEVICHEDDPAVCTYIILEGCVTLTNKPKGRPADWVRGDPEPSKELYLPWSYVYSVLTDIREEMACIKRIIQLIEKTHNAEPIRHLQLVMEETLKHVAGWIARTKDHVTDDLASSSMYGGFDLTNLVAYFQPLIDAAKDLKKHFMFLLVVRMMMKSEIELWPESKKLNYAVSSVVRVLVESVDRLEKIRLHIDAIAKQRPEDATFSWKNPNSIIGLPEDYVGSKGPILGPRRLFGDAGMGREKSALYAVTCTAGGIGHREGAKKAILLCIDRSSYKKIVAMEVCKTLQYCAAFKSVPLNQMQELAIHAIPMILPFHSALFTYGQEAKCIYVVERGEVSIEAPGKQRELIKDAIINADVKKQMQAKEEVLQQVPKTDVERACLELELKVEGMAPSPFKDAELERLAELQKEVKEIIYWRRKQAAEEESRPGRSKSDSKKTQKKTAVSEVISCLDGKKKSKFIQNKPVFETQNSQVALCGPGALIDEAHRNNPNDPKSIWIHCSDCRANSNDVKIFRIAREDFEHCTKKQWQEESNFGMTKEENRGRRIHKLDSVKAQLKWEHEEAKRMGLDEAKKMAVIQSRSNSPEASSGDQRYIDPEAEEKARGPRAEESKTRRAMAGKDSWRRNHGTFVFTTQIEEQDMVPHPPQQEKVLLKASAERDPISAASLYHQAITYNAYTTNQIPQHAQLLAYNKTRAEVPTHEDIDRVRTEIREDVENGRPVGENELQDRMQALFLEQHQDDEDVRKYREDRAQTKPKDPKVLAQIEEEAVTASQRFKEAADAKIVRDNRQNGGAGGDAAAMVQREYVGLSERTLRFISTPGLREKLRASGALTARDSRHEDGGIKAHWESPVLNVQSKSDRFNVHEPRYCRHNSQRYWGAPAMISQESEVPFQFAKNICDRQRQLANGSAEEARELLRKSVVLENTLSGGARNRWERKLNEVKITRRKPHPELMTSGTCTRWTEGIYAKNARVAAEKAEEAKRGRTPELKKRVARQKDRTVEVNAEVGEGMMGLMRDCMFPPVRKVTDVCFGEQNTLGVRDDHRPGWAATAVVLKVAKPTGVSYGAATHR